MPNFSAVTKQTERRKSFECTTETYQVLPTESSAHTMPQMQLFGNNNFGGNNFGNQDF